MKLALLVLTALAVVPPARAQSNQIPGLDVRLSSVSALSFKGREGAHPAGKIAVAMSTTACNVGTLPVPWLATDENCGGFGCECGTMFSNHPIIAFLIAREHGGRFEQISDYSFVKHGFFALSNSDCDPCQGGGNNILGVGCSDTYTHTWNGDNYWLGPAEEIDPWLGTWDVFGSHFDRGEPDVGFPGNQDGARSLCPAQATALGPLGHRVQLADADLAIPGARFWYHAMYAIRSEPLADREDNALSREFTAVHDGSEWVLTSAAVDGYAGPLLGRWEGAVVSYGEDGVDDGRVSAAVKVTGPTAGLYHYEVALHNRDSQRKVRELRLPVCSGAAVSAVGFGDLDADASNDWTSARTATELVWTSPAGAAANPLRWNSIHNFWFDSDAAPEEGALTYVPHEAGTGDLVVSGLPLPLGLYNTPLGAGCSLVQTPSLHAVGEPAQATLGNATFALESEGHDPGALAFGIAGFGGPALVLAPGCTLHMSGVLGSTLFTFSPVFADAAGLATLPLPIPNNPILEGLDLHVQAIGQRAGGGPVAGNFDLSDALLVRLGDALPGCP